MKEKMLCPLCQNDKHHFFSRDRVSKRRRQKNTEFIPREYFQCDQCTLIFVDNKFYLSSAQEKTEYDLHENNVEDEGYQKFLSRLSQPLLQRLPDSPQKGLDFGCGPGPLLAKILQGEGHDIDLFDVFFYPDQAVFSKSYDFISATEVFEHLQKPGFEIDRLWSLLKPGGVLAIMTKLALDQEAFSNWHYKNDPTHIVFFSKDTFEWLAGRLSAELEFIGADVIFLKKQ